MTVARCLTVVALTALPGIFAACERPREPSAAEARSFAPTTLQRGLRGEPADEGQASPTRSLVIDARDYGFEPPVIAARPGETIADPACGTGGFLLSSHGFITARHKDLDNDQKKHLKSMRCEASTSSPA